ncbi:multidrug resistance protein, MATE family [Cohaesibacter sp. ES.047]|uniref:MATE family efflux transporter n=1 Tax=Cohaesibacter sp. ES.047 TaxID=1798205 RepID=UPI000BB71786|nr:MATE family efflux transporter [Cohaesibacter sp. ES.047]SNY92434.1 multidrug resistance protein, MATE family [Cohaesibacter sp. ES.047]
MSDRPFSPEERRRDDIVGDYVVAQDVGPSTLSWSGETRATLSLAWPLVFTQLAQFSLNITDVIMMGWLGRDYLAAGSLATALFHPLLLFGIGSLTAVAPMAAQAIGANEPRSVRRTARQGIWVAFLLALFLMAIVFQAETIFIMTGQLPSLSALSQSYLDYAAFSLFPALGFIALRSLTSVHGETKIVLMVTILSFFVNFAGNYVLMFGHFGFPRLELAGAGISTSIVNLFVFIFMIVYVGRRHTYAAYDLFARFWRPDWHRFRDILRIGVPIGFMVMVEVALFSAATMLMGWLGTDELAAHTVAMQCAALAFMVPMGLGQATTIRIGLAFGRGAWEGIRRAGWVSIGLGVGFMGFTCMLFLTIPHVLIELFLDPSDPINAMPITLAVSYLAFAGLFQLVDGLQAVASGALRGLGDTRGPMLIAVVGYWLCGMPTSYILGFVLGWRGSGIWIGLAIGLAVTAFCLAYRFWNRERLGLLKPIVAEA